MLDRLIADELRGQLSCAILGRRIIVLDQTGSTNDAILHFATSNTEEGLVLFAEHQTAGRGQRGNRWESAPRKGLWFSILLRPRIDPATSPRLSAWAAETVSDTIRSAFSLAATVKPPNDVLINGRKVAGVLVEMRAQPGAAHLAIVGIGININQCLEDFPMHLREGAISLAMALGRQVNRQEFAVALLRDLDRTYGERFPDRGPCTPL
jgi:BirA family biotin operon repressor/biotin-[acetyl-CoA-carboxylase] ligase